MLRRLGWSEPPNVLTGCAVALLTVCALSAFTDLDFTWQIRTGAQILRTGELRTADEFTYTIAGQRVHDFEWLYEVVLCLTWESLGLGGLRLLKLLLVTAPLVLLARHLARNHVPWPGVVAAVAVAVVALYPAWNLRAMYCTTVGLLLVTTALHDHCAGRRPLPLWLPLVTLLWANLHPGVIAGQVTLLAAVAWEWANRRLRWNPPLSPPALWRLTAVGLTAVAATFLSPDPLARLLYPFRPELRHSVMGVFSEMRPLMSFADSLPLTVLLACGVGALTLVTILARPRAYRLWEVALLAVLTLLAARAVRSLQDWLLVALALGVPQVTVLLRHTLALARPGSSAHLLTHWLRRSGVGFPAHRFSLQPGWLATGAAGVVLLTFAVSGNGQPPLRGFDCPVAAVDYIERAGLRGRFFAPPDYGAYLGWRLGPDALVYVDTRGFFFPPELLEDGHHLPQLVPGWPARLNRVLDEHRTEYFLLETSGPRGRLWHKLRELNLRPLYRDDQAVLVTAAQVAVLCRPADPDLRADGGSGAD